MKKLFTLALLAGLLLTAIGTVLAQRAAKVDVCHVVGDGTFIKINISENAFDAHVDHGDAAPGELVPGMDGFKFDENCQPVPAGPTVTEGQPSRIAAIGVRYKGNSSGNDFYLGSPDLGVSANRVERQISYGSNATNTYYVTFSFDGVDQTVATITDAAGEKTLTYTVQPPTDCPISDWDVMEILVRNTPDAAADNLTFENVILDGNSLGSFSNNGTGLALKYWTVSNYDFSSGFTISGDLVVDGTWDGGERDQLQLVVGCLQ